MSDAGDTEKYSTESRLSRIESLLERFVSDTERRFTIVESQQRVSGKFSWTAFAAVAGAAGMVSTACFAFITARVGPIEANVAANAANIQQIQGEGRRDREELDARLQREMRLVNDVVSEGLRAAKEMIQARLGIDEKRLDDVTYRVDKFNDEDRQELRSVRNKEKP